MRLSQSLELRCPVVLLCNPISVLFRSIVPLSSLGLPHIFIGVLRSVGPCHFYLGT